MKGRYMKRLKPTIGQIVLLFLWVLFFVLTRVLSALPKYDQLVFVLKHLSYYTFYGLTLMLSVSVLYRILEKEFIKRLFSCKYLNIMTICILAIGLVIITKERINYIEKFETPVLTNCVYYDNLGNMIFDARYSNAVCPTFEVISISNDFVELRSQTTLNGDTWINLDLGQEVPVTIYETIDIKLIYEDGLLTTYQQNLTTAAIVYDIETRYERYSEELYVENTYQEDHFYSVQKHAYQKDVFDNLPEEFSKQILFKEEDYLFNRYDAMRTNEENMEKITISGSREFSNIPQDTNGDEKDVVSLHPIYIEGVDDSESYEYIIDVYGDNEIDDHGLFVIKEDEVLVTKENPRAGGPEVTKYHEIDGYLLLEEHSIYEKDEINRRYFHVDYYKTVLSNELKGISDFNDRRFLLVDELDFGVVIRFYEERVSTSNGLLDNINMSLGNRFIDYRYFDYYSLFETANEESYLIWQQNPLLLRYGN